MTAEASTTPEKIAVRPDDPGRAVRQGQIILVIFFVVILGAAALIPLSSAAVATGEVAVRGNVQTLEAGAAGRVTQILVREGQRVQRGQVLVQIDPELAQAQLDVLQDNWDALKAQEARLLAERSGATAIRFDPDLMSRIARPATATAVSNERLLFFQRLQEGQLEQAMYEAQMDQHGTTELTSERQAQASNRQIELVRQELDGVQQLRRQGFAPRTRVSALQSRLAGLDQEREQYLNSAGLPRRSIGESRLALARAQTARLNSVAQELNATQVRLTELAPQVLAARRNLDLTRLRAPATGQVVGLRVFTIGAVVTTGERMLDVVPSGAPLLIEARVSPADIDDVHGGARAEVRFTSLAARLERSVEGTVETVSADTLRDETSGATYYLAAVRMDQPERARELQLTPGMPAEVLIRARSRTLLQYLVEPLTDQLARAFREE